ncbi:MAG: guanylate kinase [Oscillospiraceae bacterium]|nr:guanylate kinase [Oscillospiraceae bacterium]
MEKMINVEQTEKIEQNSKSGKLVIISGPAGSGKGTVLKELFNLSKDNEYKYSVSATTRSLREGEVEGVNYYFLSREDFFKKIANGDMLEYVEYSGNYYGTPREPVEKMLRFGYNVILEIEVVGAINIKEKFPQAVMIFLTPPTYAELEKRLRTRGTEAEEVIQKRLAISKKEVNCIDKYDYLVINDTDLQKETAFTVNCLVEADLKTTEEHKINTQKAVNFLKSYFNN